MSFTTKPGLHNQQELHVYIFPSIAFLVKYTQKNPDSETCRQTEVIELH